MSFKSRTNTIRMVLDVLMLILVAMPSIVFKVGGIEPTHRGFFCDDDSIRYPYHESTISTTVLILVGGFTNLIVVLMCEILHYVYDRKNKKAIFSEELFGITDIGKWTVGRLRPHFIDGCQPQGFNITTCPGNQYMDTVHCTRPDQTILDDLRLSFPSGHASQSAYTMVFLACYVQQRVPRFDYTYLVKHVIQFILICMAWFCGLSRVMDNKHHPTDVLAGFTIGTVVALLCARYVVKRFREPYTNGPYRRCHMRSSQADLVEDPEAGTQQGI
ncbi:hypothetical protein EB796_017215 [Bugula neritina]|uniref:Phosphatidic acid phosphatase type 2/haloperoxidase domain-containing protein n=1 Tax=Bugula neritina TaxID=10212 RepID=A0A7J7JEL9_BUGNE|nr:hypothetical protein EB796_017215 [Bugula neritina]